MIIEPEFYRECLKCPHCFDDDEGLYCHGECAENAEKSEDIPNAEPGLYNR